MIPKHPAGPEQSHVAGIGHGGEFLVFTYTVDQVQVTDGLLWRSDVVSGAAQGPDGHMRGVILKSYRPAPIFVGPTLLEKKLMRRSM